MEYVHLGRTGLKVSRFCLGTMNFGPQTNEKDSFTIMDKALELGINFFDFRITNNTTGQYLEVKCPCPVNTALTVDCVNKKAYLADGTVVRVTLSSDREEWLDLNAGSNTLQFDDTGTVAVTGVVQHRDRVL